MKAYFAAMKKLLSLGACLVALTSPPAMAQTGATDFVVVKVIESTFYLEVFIARPGSPPEHREFKSRELSELGNGMQTGGTAEATRRLLVELAQQGYILTTTYSTTTQNGMTTLVFTKKP